MNVSVGWQRDVEKNNKKRERNGSTRIYKQVHMQNGSLHEHKSQWQKQ